MLPSQLLIFWFYKPDLLNKIKIKYLINIDMNVIINPILLVCTVMMNYVQMFSKIINCNRRKISPKLCLAALLPY